MDIKTRSHPFTRLTLDTLTLTFCITVNYRIYCHTHAQFLFCPFVSEYLHVIHLCLSTARRLLPMLPARIIALGVYY